ncbi:MAG: hypothetical protein FJY83_01495 [Candidatus Aminicenantes bacterium]|nr:hypothetical protein [Candidatus Aminicenantes bacterium]
MRRRARPQAGFLLAGLIALAWLGAAACVNFRPAVQPPGLEVESLVVCRNAAFSGGLHVAEGAARTFGLDIPSLFALASLRDIDRGIALRFKWYAPDGVLARDSGPMPVDPGEKYLDKVTAFDRLDFAPGRIEPREGAWTVVLFLDETPADQTSFNIKK